MKPPVLGPPVPGFPMYEADHAQAEAARYAEDAQILGFPIAPSTPVNPSDIEDQIQRTNRSYIESIPTPCCQAGGIFMTLSRRVVCSRCTKLYKLDQNMKLVRYIPTTDRGEER